MEDATSFYRGVGPLDEMQRRYRDKLNVIYVSDHKDSIERIRRCGKPVWVDYDDYLHGVPLSNPAYKDFSGSEISGNISQILKAATVITVSTPELKKAFCLGDNCRIVRNALDESMMVRRSEGPQKRIVSWRGTDTHVEDLLTVKDEINASVEINTHEFVFFGYSPWFVPKALNVKHIGGVDVPSFFYLLNIARPQVHYVPLSDSQFNRSKSNIAWLEASYYGAAVLAPDFPEWKRNGVTVYQSASDFGEKLRGLMADPDKCAKLNEMSMKTIRAEYMLEDAVTKRFEILNTL
jgi:hypothetical protein